MKITSLQRKLEKMPLSMAMTAWFKSEEGRIAARSKKNGVWRMFHLKLAFIDGWDAAIKKSGSKEPKS